MKAVVMAGGEGTRLRPLTCNLPKPLVPVCNKPVMEYIIELLKAHGFTQIIVTLHYLADEIVSYFGDGSPWGVQIIYSVEDEPLGTAGSVKKAEQYLDDTFLIISGDALTDFDLSSIVAAHKARQATATITLTRVDSPLEYGVVITDEEGRIRRFLEKPSWGEVFSDTINTGIYVLEPEIFNEIPAGKVFDFSKDLFPQLLAKNKAVFGHVTGGYWCDIGNLQQYRQSHYDLLNGRVKAAIPGKETARGVWVGEGTEIHPSAHIQGPVVIGRNCRIQESAAVEEFSSIGDNCILEEGSGVHRGILWSNVYVGKKSRITGATLARHTTLKAYVNVSEGAVLGDKCFLGQGSVVHPQVKIWPDKNVEAGATVSMSLIWGIKWPGSLFSTRGIAGLANIEITPEFALKLGAAYGAFLEKGATICTSRDAHPASRMINRSIICGLISVGVDVHDLRVMPTPIARHTIKSIGARGGIHARISPDDPRSIVIEFFDSRGIAIDKGTERKIENLFFREDFRRTPMDEVGLIDFPARALDEYTEGFFAKLSADPVRRAHFKVVVDYAFGNTYLVLPLLLGKLGCDTVAINAIPDSLKSREAAAHQKEGLAQLADIVTTLRADLGVRMDSDGERLILIDGQGKIIEGPRLLALAALMTWMAKPGALVAVPVTQSQAFETLGERFGGTVIRTKTDSRSLMHTASLGQKRIALAGSGEGALIFPEFQQGFDAMFAFAKILELLALRTTTLGELAAQLPAFHTAEGVVECVWQQKGKIMRRMIEESRAQRVEMLEGVKVFTEGGWVLVIPDPAEPLVHLYAEGASAAEAEALVADYTARIEAGKATGDPPAGRPRDRAGTPGDGSPQRRSAGATEVLPEDRVFHFWNDRGPLGVVARSLKEFVDTLRFVEPGALEYHARRRDWSRWLEEGCRNPDLAKQVAALEGKDLAGENLRNALLHMLAAPAAQGARVE